jgi:ribonuclease I
VLTAAFNSPDPAVAKRAFEAMMTMRKIDVAQDRGGGARLADGEGRISAGALRSAFAAANPGLAQEAIHVGANLDGRLMEVRVCFDKSFAMAACPGMARGAADSSVLAVAPISQ